MRRVLTTVVEESTKKSNLAYAGAFHQNKTSLAYLKFNPKRIMYNDRETTTFLTVYMIFGLGCILFFLFGVCALLCCCRSRFRGVERKGYVIREAGSTQPLIQPGMQAGNQSVVMTGAFPAQPGFSPQVMHHNPPQAPPPYEMPAKY